MIKSLKSVFFKKIDARGLAVFRMVYVLILLSELIHLNFYKSIIFNKIPFVEVGEFKIELLLNFWYISLLFIFLGLFTRISTIVNYLFSVIIFSSASAFEYH